MSSSLSAVMPKPSTAKRPTLFERDCISNALSPREKAFIRLLVVLTKTIEKAKRHNRLPYTDDCDVAFLLNDDTPVKYIPKEFVSLCSSIGVYLHDVHTPGLLDVDPDLDVKMELPIVCYPDRDVPTHEATPYLIVQAPADRHTDIRCQIDDTSPDSSYSLSSLPASDGSDQGNWSLEYAPHSPPGTSPIDNQAKGMLPLEFPVFYC